MAQIKSSPTMFPWSCNFSRNGVPAVCITTRRTQVAREGALCKVGEYCHEGLVGHGGLVGHEGLVGTGV